MTPAALMMPLKFILRSLITDRHIVAGATTGGGTLGAAKVASEATPAHLEQLAQLQSYAVIFATLCGALVSIATLVLICIKIRRILRSPSAVD